MVDSEKYPPMGFIYEAMDRAKEKIAQNLNHDVIKYQIVWDIVDSRWDRLLHTHLHAAAYFLNPHFQYEPSFSSHHEIKLGLYSCMERLIGGSEEREKVDLPIDSFRNAQGLFGRVNAVSTRKKRSPADWWRAFGDQTPKLAKFAIRTLSLTSSASGCERDWSSFNQYFNEQVHTKRRNRLKQAKLNDLVYIMFNLKLKLSELKKKTIKDSLCLDDVDSGDE
ncbi:uncharacterized protein LOC124809441 [Hydra vulgaris]|uniref:uncharacterized protein LOC124809441 n=1 Tax=Hydra vulgaris TaxID=6087 RepID=UPI001F5F6675|nr:uncharacterized protein LOC124809441 [Hydra vulgaris]